MPKINFLILILVLCSFFSYGQTVSFTYQNTSAVALCSPASISFTQTCTGNPIGFTWFFDNGQESNDPNPTVSFLAGTYIIKLQAIFENAVLETSQTIVVKPSFTSSLTANKNYICLPGNIDFTVASSAAIASYDWNFGDGITATNNNASFTHTYSTLGTFNVTTKATDINGCFATALSTITIKNPPISGTISASNGCAPINVNLLASVEVPTGSTVTNYSWNFGDGSPVMVTPTGIAPHTFIDSGNYIPSLTITTVEGCTNSYTYPTISFGIPPINHIAYPKKVTYCGSETTALVAKATYANAYKWDYGDGIIETIYDTITTHKFATLGTKFITVTPYFNGCAGVTLPITVNIVGVIASFTFSNTCIAKKTFSFTNTSLGNQSTRVWNFGDASPNIFTLNANHIYPIAGAFTTSLTIADNATGCRDSFAVNIFTASPKLINNDTFLCRNSNTTFTIQNNFTNANATYKWEVVGLSNNNSSNPFSVTATTFNNFISNFVVINNGTQYCPDTSFLDHSIAVRGPNLSYTLPSNFCSKKTVAFTNTSSPYSLLDTIKLWYWNYGIAPKNDSIFQPLPFVYPSAGGYIIKLFAKDNKGCIDSLAKSVVVKASPLLRVFPRADTLCQGKKDTLFAFTSDTLYWSPASFVSCNTCDTVLAYPTTTTTFYATAINSNGCKIIDSSIIKVFEPFKISPINNPVMVCTNDTARINVFPLGKKILWSPATGLSNNTMYNPLVSVINSTVYNVSLMDSVGCFSADTFINVIAKPLPIVQAGANKIYPYNTSFTIAPNYSSNIILYHWTPASNLDCTNCKNPNGIALNAQTFIIKVTNDEGCMAKDTISIFVECKYANLFMPSAFAPKTLNNNNFYYPITRGIKTVKRFSIFNRYGQIIFDTKNIQPNEKTLGWDGKFRGIEQPSDAYVYVLEAVCDQGETFIKKDSFVLIK
jgi:gliding motility-associated-like protein